MRKTNGKAKYGMMLKTGQYTLMVALHTCHRNNIKNKDNATVKGILLEVWKKSPFKMYYSYTIPFSL
jgi:hypothetical protein